MLSAIHTNSLSLYDDYALISVHKCTDTRRLNSNTVLTCSEQPQVVFSFTQIKTLPIYFIYFTQYPNSSCCELSVEISHVPCRWVYAEWKQKGVKSRSQRRQSRLPFGVVMQKPVRIACSRKKNMKSTFFCGFDWNPSCLLFRFPRFKLKLWCEIKILASFQVPKWASRDGLAFNGMAGGPIYIVIARVDHALSLRRCIGQRRHIGEEVWALGFLDR